MPVTVRPADEAMTPQAVTWHSPALGRPIKGRLLNPIDLPGTIRPLVIYQKNLGVPRIGRETDETILNDLVQGAVFVLVLDYEHDAKAVSPALNADALRLRADLAAGPPASLAGQKGRIDMNRVFPLAEGFRLEQGVTPDR